VLAAVLWLGGGALIALLAWKAQRAKDNAQLLQIAKQAEWASTRIFVPASLVVVAMGVVLMHKGHWGYGNFWPLFGLGAWCLSFLAGAAFLGPQSGKLAKLIELKGPGGPAVAARTSPGVDLPRFSGTPGVRRGSVAPRRTPRPVPSVGGLPAEARRRGEARENSGVPANEKGVHDGPGREDL